MTKRICIIGAGSAGVITAAQLCANVPNGYEIVSVYDPNTPILGIGESTNSGIIRVLEQACQFSFIDDMHEMDSTLKFGNKFIDWRKDEWLNPLLDGGIAIHINNFKLKEFVFKRLLKLWPKKFQIIEATVLDIRNVHDGALVEMDKVSLIFDYVIDTRGFPKDWTNYHLVDSLPINRAIIHTVYEPGDWQYTEHQATKNGWMFGIPLINRRTYGYLFNDNITSREEALEDISNIFNTTIDQIGRHEGQMEYQFKSYYSTGVFDGHIMKNGNRAIFFEPISASSIFFYIYTNYIFIDFLKGNISQEQVNKQFINYAQKLEDLICFFYHGGSIHNTAFWNFAVERTTGHLMKSTNFKHALTNCFEMNEIGLPHYSDPWIFGGYHLNLIDKKFGYNYFSDPVKNKHTLEKIKI